MTIGERIKQARIRANMTQEQLAKRMRPRLSRLSIIQYEKRDDVNWSTIERIAKALGCTVHDIVCKRN